VLVRIRSIIVMIKWTGLTQDDMEQRVATVDLTGKHIVECEALEKRRYQSRSGNRQVFNTLPKNGSSSSSSLLSLQVL